MAEPDNPGSFKRLGRRAGHAVFPPPPLKFRTAGFPQYGFKLEFGRNLRQGITPNLYAARSPDVGPCGPCGHVGRGVSLDVPAQRPLARQRVMLSHRVIAYYGLIRASRPLLPTYVFAGRSLPSGQGREVPHFYLRVLRSVPSPLPRRTVRLHLVVAWPIVVAFTVF